MRLVGMSFWLVLLASVSPLWGQARGFSCPTAVPVPATGTGERKADLDAAVSLFEGMMGPKLKAPPFSAKLKAEYNTTQIEIMSKYPHADKLALGQQELAIGCGLIKDSSLTDAEKLKQYNLLMKEVNNFISPSHVNSTGKHTKATSSAPASQVPGYVGGNYCPSGNCPSNTTISTPPPPKVTFTQSDEVSGDGRFSDTRFMDMAGLTVLIINLKGDFANPSFFIQCNSACGTRDTKLADRQRAEVYWDVGYRIERRSGTDFVVKLDNRLYDGDKVLVYIVAMGGQPVTITNAVGL
jgi:hypothetical protein